LTRTPSLHNYGLTSSNDQLTAKETANSDPVATDNSTVTSDPVAVPGRVRFAATTLDISDEATVNSTPFKRYTSPTAGDTVDALYCPGDYDNTAGDDDVKELSQRPSASSTSSSTAIKPSEEESLDNLLAHLLGEVTSPTSAVQGLPDTCDGQPTWSDRGASSSLHWPQGDSLPRVEMRRKVLHDVPVSGDKLLSDENDNVVKHDVTLQDVITDLTTLQVNAPPLLTVRKKATCSDDVAISSERGPPAKFSMTPGSNGAGKDEQRNPSLSNGSAEVMNVAAHQLSYSESVQRTSLMDEFKALRLQVLTSTSQLLSCVSGTWKRGESFRSKLTAIMQLCLELRTSVGKLEMFLQSALSMAAANSPVVDTANTRVKNLQAVQTSIDAYIETLDVENLSAGIADKQDLKVGGIIHLTKEIPGLVRTFAPVVEHLAATTDEPDSAAEPHQSDTISDHQHSSDKNLESETRSRKELEEKIPDQDQVKQTSREHSAIACVIAPETLNERGRSSDEQVRITTTSANIDIKPAMFPPSQTNQDQPSQPKIPETTPTIVDTDFTTLLSQMSPKNTKNTQAISGDDRKDVNRGDDSERRSQQTVLPVLRTEAETVAPPTPPPKLRVASLYHASLGISNSLTSAATTSETTATTTTTAATGRYGDDAVVTTYNPQATKSPTEDHGDTVTVSADKFPPTNRQPDDGSSDVLAVIDYVSGCGDIVVAAADRRYFKFPRATDATTVSEQPAVVLRKHPANVDQGTQHGGRVSESELETPEFRASGVSQTTVEQLEALQRQASAQAVVTHTDSTAGYDRFDPRSPNPQYQSTLTAEDRRLLMFYCDQMTGHWNVLDDAASAFFHCMDRRQPPKVFVSHSKFVIVAGHKMAYLGDVLARNIVDDNAQNWIVAHSNRLCNSLKTAVRRTKEAALAYPSVPEQQLMVDCIKEVTDWAIELKEVVDRLAYIGRPDHVLI